MPQSSRWTSPILLQYTAAVEYCFPGFFFVETISAIAPTFVSSNWLSMITVCYSFNALTLMVRWLVDLSPGDIVLDGAPASVRPVQIYTTYSQGNRRRPHGRRDWTWEGISVERACIHFRHHTRHYVSPKLTGWRNVWNMRWRAPDQEVDQRRHGERLCKKITKHVIWTRRGSYGSCDHRLLWPLA